MMHQPEKKPQQGHVPHRPVLYTPPELTGTLKQAKRQHVHNLLAILDRCLLAGDTELTASVCSLALALLDVNYYNESNIKESQEMRGPQWRISGVFNAVAEVLLNTPQLPTAQVTRYLQHIATHAATHIAAEQAANNVSLLLLLKGDYEAAYRLMSNPGRGRPTAQAPLAPLRAALCGDIRHQQWLQAMQEFRSSHPMDLQVLTATPGLQPNASPMHIAMSPIPTDSHSLATAFIHDRRLWALASASNSVRDAWRECEIQLKEGLSVWKDATLLSILLAHAYVVSGRFSNALQVASTAVSAANNDADAHALHAIVYQLAAAHSPHDVQSALRMRGDTTNDTDFETYGFDWLVHELYDSHTPAHTLAVLHHETLNVDPFNAASTLSLFASRNHCDLCRMSAAHAAMLYLDMLTAAPLSSDSVNLAWTCLASAIQQLSKYILPFANSPELQQPPSQHDARIEPQYAVRYWSWLRSELLQRAGWWTEMQLSINQLRSHLHWQSTRTSIDDVNGTTTAAARAGAGANMLIDQGSEHEGHTSRRAGSSPVEVPRTLLIPHAVLLTAAVMLGPRHAHVQQMVDACIEHEHALQGSTQDVCSGNFVATNQDAAGCSNPPLDETSKQAASVEDQKPTVQSAKFWPDSSDAAEAVAKLTSMKPPAWAQEALAVAEQIVTAEYHHTTVCHFKR